MKRVGGARQWGSITRRQPPPSSMHLIKSRRTRQLRRDHPINSVPPCCDLLHTSVIDALSLVAANTYSSHKVLSRIRGCINSPTPILSHQRQQSPSLAVYSPCVVLAQTKRRHRTGEDKFHDHGQDFSYSQGGRIFFSKRSRNLCFSCRSRKSSAPPARIFSVTLPDAVCQTLGEEKTLRLSPNGSKEALFYDSVFGAPCPNE